MLLPLIALLPYVSLAQDNPEAGATPLWVDRTDELIGETGEWTNRVELADLDGDGWVDILFANGGNYSEAGELEHNRAYLNQGPGKRFKEVSRSVFGETPDTARVIQVRDVSGDGVADLFVGTTFQTQSRLYLGLGGGAFEEVTATHLPQAPLSVGDVDLGDVDGDGDLDLVLADWGPGNNMQNEGGRTRLWLNQGDGHFVDSTEAHMPEDLVQFSWDLDLLDVDEDMDLDLVVSCKMCIGSRLFLNDGMGTFTSPRRGGLPRYTNNYELEGMDLDGDGHLDLVTVNDGEIVGFGAHRREHVFKGTGRGFFMDVTHEWWLPEHNLGHDDNMVAFLDHDSDGDADFLLASLSGPDRLLVNDGKGHLSVRLDVFDGPETPGTLAFGIADLDGDHRMDVVQAQGEHPRATQERVHLGLGLAPDTAPPTIGEVLLDEDPAQPGTLRARVRIHDRKSPCEVHDWDRVLVELSEGGVTSTRPLEWYGGFLWRAEGLPHSAEATMRLVAVDAAGNEASTEPRPLVPRERQDPEGARRRRR